MRIIENKIFTESEDDGLQFLGPSDSDVLVSNCEFSNCGDELSSVVKGATNIIFEDCLFHDTDKGILVGTGDACDYESEKDVVVVFRRCLSEGVARRSPFFRYGTCYIENCEVRNWKGGYKTHGLKFEGGATVNINGLHLHQDRFRFEPVNWIRGGGCWNGIKTDGTCIINGLNTVTKNKWWIKI